MPTKNKVLKAQYQAKWYRNHTAAQKQRVAIRNLRVISENHNRVYDYLEQHPCIDCGESNPIILDFDHNNRDDKKDDISALVSHGHSWTMIEREISKCSVRCANCHRIKTSKEGNYFRWKIWCERRDSNSRSSD
jgi:hypothetical protein